LEAKMREVTVALVGMGGYGNIYARMLLEDAAEHGVRLVAGVDPFAERSGNLEKFQLAGIPVYAGLADFYAQDKADLVVISTAIHLHAPMTLQALAQGSHVLCEKPVCATLEEYDQMLDAEKRAGRFVAIGYQWSYAKAIQELKKDILSGKLGRPLRFKSLVLWPRGISYYRRNDWAGKIRSADGAWIYDSPVHNATAHYLHNLFFLLGEAPGNSAGPADVQAECYRVNAIENYDAAAVRCHVCLRGQREPVEILFYAAHPVRNERGPLVHLEFEDGVVEYERGEGTVFKAYFQDGRTKIYGDPYSDESDKLWQAAEAVRGRGPILCDLLAALPQLRTMHAMRLSTEICQMPEEKIANIAWGDGDRLYYSDELEASLRQAYTANCLPGELERYPWAQVGKVVEPGR
jgi:predicted dehydrogenase